MDARLRQDVYGVVGSLEFRGNCSSAMGYLYCVASDGNSVSTGMACHNIDEITPDEWDGYLDLDKKGYPAGSYDLNNKRSFNTLMNRMRRTPEEDTCSRPW